MATIADVAALAGVSIATVSRVLSPGRVPHPVSMSTALRVRAAAQSLDFVPSELARGLASRRSGLVGLIVPDLADPHYPQVARGVEDLARLTGFAVLMCTTLGEPDRLAEYLHLLRARRVDAIVLSGGSSLQPEELEAVQRFGVPAVLIGRPARGSLPYVAVDNLGAGQIATHHLWSLGRRRIAHLAGPSAQTTMADRAAGYRAAMHTHGLPPDWLPTDGSGEQGLRVALAVLSREPSTRPDAIFAATDRLSVAALAAAVDLGLRVPADLALIGFDDLPVLSQVRPPLSSIAQPARQLGETALRLAQRLVAGEQVASQVLPARLVVRASTG